MDSDRKELESQMQQLLRELSRKEGGRAQEREQVVIAEIREKGGAVKKFMEAFGNEARDQVVTFRWHPRFRKHLTPEPPREGVLCAFGAIQDLVFTPAGMEDLIRWLVKNRHVAPRQALDDLFVAGQKPKEVISLAQEMLEALLYSMSQPPALKPVLKDAELRSALRDFVAGLSQPDKVRPVLGGASAIIAEFLSQLGVANTRLYSSYRSTDIARLFLGDALTLEVDVNGSVTADRRVKDAGEQTHPTRSSYILPYNAGRTIADPTRPKSLLRHPQTGQPITARQDDRLIYRVFNHIRDHMQQWDDVIIETDSGELLQGPTGLDKDEWPFVAGFVDWDVTTDKKLKIRFLKPSQMAEIGRRFRYVILNAPGLRSFTGPESVLPQDALGKMLSEALVKQIAALREAGCKIHLELSGGAGENDRLMPFARSLRSLIGSLGLNQEELRQVTNLPDCPQPNGAIPHPSEIFNRYQRARQLAETLDADRLYVHGNDVDLVLRRNGSPGDMHNEIQADLFTKGVVVAGVLQRSTDDWVAEINNLEPLLTADGFIRLIEFGFDFARLRHPAPSSPLGMTVEGKQLFRNLVETGYYIATASNEYSVAVIPVMWPRLPAGINPTGAGDICSGISLVYSGW